jgi:hypothetical protein
MHKPKPGKAGITPKTAVQVQPGKVANKRRGLVLDDFLAQIDFTRETYKLPEATFGLEQIESQAAARPAMERIITSSLARHAPNFYANPHPLLDKIYDIRRGKRIDKPLFYSGWQIQRAHAPEVMRALLERGLQTIVQLPKKDPPLKDGKRELKLLALHCAKLAKEFRSVFEMREVRNRASAYFRETPGPGLDQFSRQAEELQRIAETVRTVLAKTRMVRQKTDSPNPQVRTALYVVRWLEASCGEKQYGPFRTLLNAAYAANAMGTPAWVDRLEIEMNRHRARRKAWARSITV